MENLDLTYPAVVKQISSHLDSGRSESQAFMAWFLEHYYRLEIDSAKDCVCDGRDDKGID